MLGVGDEGQLSALPCREALQAKQLEAEADRGATLGEVRPPAQTAGGASEGRRQQQQPRGGRRWRQQGLRGAAPVRGWPAICSASSLRHWLQCISF